MIDFNRPLSPMLAVPADPFSSADYSYEIKWDGFRAIAFLDPGSQMRLQSRNLKPLLPRFPALAFLNRQVERKMILDGEIVSFVDGKPNFSALTRGQGQISYLAFDLLWLEGEDLTPKPLFLRQRRLAEVEGLAKSLPLATDGLSALAEARRLGLEGIMAKERESPYLPGVRSKAWLKFKLRKKAVAVIGGYKRGEALSLLLGAWQGTKLRFLGKVAVGSFKEKTQLPDLFAQYHSPHCPFFPEPQAKCSWLLPKLTGTVSYLELTASGSLRQASWLGLSKKSSAACLWEDF